jgi:hypothetical protein
LELLRKNKNAKTQLEMEGLDLGDQPGFCSQCGQALGAGQRFCGQCDSERAAVPGPAKGSALEAGLGAPGLQWEAEMGLVTNPMVMKQMAFLLGVTWLIMSGLISFIFALDGQWQSIPKVLLGLLLAVGALGLAVVLIMLVFFANRVRYRFTVNDKGVFVETVSRRARTANRLAVSMGALQGHLGTTGAGLIAVSREAEFYPWPEIARASYHPGWRGISLSSGWRTLALLTCTPDNYAQVAAYVRQMVATAPG